jgi:mannose-6-phosphate isomerase-like protein (cupin superfamily)
MKISEAIEIARKTNLEYIVLKNWHQPTPKWKEFELLCGEFQGRVSIKEKPLTDIMNMFLEKSKEAYPNIDYEFFLMQADSFRNLNPEESGTYAHTDPHDVLHWQCRGVTEWTIGSNSDKIQLEPGDLLWFRANTKHKTENLTEKYALIFNAGKLSYDQ